MWQEDSVQSSMTSTDLLWGVEMLRRANMFTHIHQYPSPTPCLAEGHADIHRAMKSMSYYFCPGKKAMIYLIYLDLAVAFFDLNRCGEFTCRAVNLLLVLKCVWETRRSTHQGYRSMSMGLKLQLLVCRLWICTKSLKCWFSVSEALRNASLHFPERLKATRCSVCHADVSQSDTPCSDAIFGVTG